MSDLRSDFALYQDDNGLIQLHPHPTIGDSDNPLLFTGHYLIILARNGLLREEDSVLYEHAARTCEVEKGLFNRRQGHTAQEGPDDYVGLATGSYLTKSSFAKDVLDYGRSHLIPARGLLGTETLTAKVFNFLLGWVKLPYVYNNDHRGLMSGSAFLGRQAQLIAHLEWAADERPPVWRQLAWALVLLHTNWSDPNDTDAKILSWHLLEVAGDRTWLNRLIKRHWQKRLMQAYPGGMKDVFTLYFGAAHPISVYSPRV